MKITTVNCPEKFTKSLNQLEVAVNNILKIACPELHNQTINRLILVNFITDTEIQLLNKQFRGKDKPTDVLSWSYIDSNLQPNEIAGELYVSLETAKRQATEKNIDLNLHLCFLITHGLLHVYHYDHNTDAEEQEMDLVTQKILKEFSNIKNL